MSQINRLGKASRAAVLAAMVSVGLLLPATAARADGAFYGHWRGSSIVYVHWGDGCDASGIDFPPTALNVNFSGGIRPDGTTYVYDFFITNGATHELNFPNGFTLWSGSVTRHYYIERIPGGGSAHRVVDTVFPSTSVAGNFFPVVDANRPCNNTQLLISP
jgi:hypothetical protein